MRKTLLAFDKVPQLAKTDVAYSTGDARFQPFIQYKPELAAFETAIANRAGFETPRAALTAVLREQYRNLPVSALVQAQIEALGQENTFTVTTAHQPALFLGPLYFVYKAITTINLAEAITKSSGKHIVPIFVLGSEDHDLDELNHINLFNKRITWQPGLEGPVGSMSAATVAPALAELKEILGESEAAQQLYARIARCYETSETFAEATQALLHYLFGQYGLVVLNMSHPDLKRLFIPVMKAELLEQVSFKLVSESAAALQEAGFKIQAAPREINLFYLRPGARDRIVYEGGVYKVLNTNIVFDQAAMLAELEQHPERFSPNVVLRPLFQELILPNLAYVGGGGELAYWLERKAQFAYFNIHYPVLIRRNSLLWLDKDAQKKLQKFGFSASEFFEDPDALVRAFIEKNASGEVSLADEINEINALYERLAQKAAAVDPTLDKAVRAEAVKAVSGLEQWQGRLMRAEKQKHEVVINQIRALKEKLYPGGGLQERSDNFIPYLLKYGEGYLAALKEHLGPFDAGFVILEEE